MKLHLKRGGRGLAQELGKMYDDERSSNALDWAKLMFIVMLALGLAYGVYTAGPFIGKALLADDIFSNSVDSQQNIENKRKAEEIRQIGFHKSQAVNIIGESLQHFARRNPDALNHREYHELPTFTSMELDNRFFELCKHSFLTRHPRTTTYQVFEKQKEEYIKKCMTKMAVDEGKRREEQEEQIKRDKEHHNKNKK